MCKCLKILFLGSHTKKKHGKKSLKVGKRYRLKTRSIKKVNSGVFTWYKVCENHDYDKIKAIFDRRVAKSGELFEFLVVDKLAENEVVFQHTITVKEIK